VTFIFDLLNRTTFGTPVTPALGKFVTPVVDCFRDIGTTICAMSLVLGKKVESFSLLQKLSIIINYFVTNCTWLIVNETVIGNPSVAFGFC